jgi:mono/diheme cytochrome c family protein
MRSASTSLSLFAAMALTVPTLALAAEMTIGQHEYETHCAACHGNSGLGDGWFSRYLKNPMPTIRQLKKKNGGVFPVAHVYDVIDGKKEVSIHGSREMPIWGNVFSVEDQRVVPFYGQIPADQGVVRARILALTEYISQLQE